MFTEWTCKDCQFGFSVGTVPDNTFASGYAGYFLLVCSCCGTQHQIRFALDDRGPERWDMFEVLVENITSKQRIQLMAWLRHERGMTMPEAKRLINQPLILLKQDLYEHEAQELLQEFEQIGITVFSRKHGSEENLCFGPLMQNEFSAFPGPQKGQGQQEPGSILPLPLQSSGMQFFIDGQFNSAAIPCNHCGSKNALVNTWHEKDNCPACQGKLRMEREAIT